MTNNILKWALTLVVAALTLTNTYVLSDLKPGALAATYALIASAVLFVRLLPGQGTSNRWANFVLGYTGSITTFLAAWFWLAGEDGLQSTSHALVVLAVFLTIALVLIINAISTFRSLGQEEDDE